MNQQRKTARNNTSSKPESPGISELLNSRSMPESPEAEAAVLGSMVLDHECIGEVIQQLHTDAFYRAEHQTLFDAIVSLYEKTTSIDLVVLRDELKKRNQLKEVGGVDYLIKVVDSVPSSANVGYYLEIVKEKSLMRELIRATGEILWDAYMEGGEAGEKLDLAEQKIFQVTQKKVTGAAIPIKELLLAAFEAIENRKGSHITGLPTGIRELDELTCGLQKGEMIIIAGRPSMGKTSFALNIAEHIGADNDIPIAVFSLEMSKQQLAERVLCSRGHIDAQLVRKGMLSADQYQQLIQTGSELSEKPIYIDDTAGITPLEIRAKARRLRSQYKIKCLVVDYLQLMSLGTAKIESRQQEITTISRYLKGLARELEIPVVVLSQLNRGPEGREGHRPRMSDLRESGSIEQDADVVILLHREDYYHRGEQDYTPTNEAEIIVAKQRNGPTDTVKVIFDEKYTRFKDQSYATEPF